MVNCGSGDVVSMVVSMIKNGRVRVAHAASVHHNFMHPPTSIIFLSQFTLL